VSKAGGAATDLASWPTARVIAVDDSGVYFGTQDILTAEGAINLVSVGSPAKQIAGNLKEIVSLVLDADAFYTAEQPINDTGFVKQWAKKGGMATTLATTTAASDLLVDATSAYWIDAYMAIMKRDKP
jgi:hypothetical protein